jgi:hypothetical protein
LLIGSNHPKRVSLLNKNYQNFKKEKISIESIIFSNNKFETINIFIGDSHAEFYGRNYTENKLNNFFLTYWLGPVLLTNFSTSSKIIYNIHNFIKIIHYLTKKKASRLNIIFSFGEIDIRNFYYRVLILDKNFKNEKKLNNFIINNLNKNLIILKNLIKKEDISFYFKEISPAASRKGFRPKNELELKKININFPNLGSIKERVRWTNITNEMIEDKLDQNFFFLKLGKKKEIFNSNGTISGNCSNDDNHINNPKQIINFQKKLNMQKY